MADLDGLINHSVWLLQLLEPPEGYYLAFSGGKDSVVLYALARLAGVKFDTHYNVTSADPPELVRFIRREYPDAAMDRSEWTMWTLIPNKRMPPTRLIRYCCDFLKERSGEGRTVLTGVKASDSTARRHRTVTSCYKKNQYMVRPMLDWTDGDVWAFIRSRGLRYCELYDQGFKRLGCIGCPMAGTKRQREEFVRWPKYRGMYLRAFGRMLEERRRMGQDTNWRTAEDVMAWWLGEAKGVKVKRTKS